MDKLIDTDLLEYYDSKTRIREDEKINSIPFANSMEYVKWYFDVHRDGKIYGVKFAYDANDCLVATGTKYGANTNLVAQPSTRTVSGRNDYENITVFKHFDANAHLDDNGNTIIDAINGDKNFSYYGKVDVVCVFAPVYEKIYVGYESTTKYLYIEWCDTPRPGFTLNKLCKDGQGNNKGFYCITKFQAGLIDGVPYASAGLYPWTNPFIDKLNNIPCYNSCVDTYHDRHAYMCAMTMAEWVMLQRIFLMKYANTDSQTVLGGIFNNAQGLPILCAADNKNYVILSTSNANKFYNNSFIDIGSSTIRVNVHCKDIAWGLEILGKNSNIVIFNNLISLFTIDDENYTLTTNDIDAAVQIPSGTDTTAYDPNNDKIFLKFNHDGSEINVSLNIELSDNNYVLNAYDNGNLIGHSAIGTTGNTAIMINRNVTFDLVSPKYVFTAFATTGYSLDICGDDGSWEIGDFVNDNNHASVLSGIEFQTGICDLIGNTYSEYDENHKLHVRVCNSPNMLSKDESEMENTFIDVGEITYTIASTNWSYIHNITYDLINGALMMNTGLGSSSKGFSDGAYVMTNKTSSNFGFQVFGAIGSITPKGIFCAATDKTLDSTTWDLGTRPSLNGVMG